jgi:hypothetical protein
MDKVPKIVRFQKIGNQKEGYLSICENIDIVEFDVKRVFWNYGTPNEVTRGRHAHYETEMVIIAITGEVKVSVITIEGEPLKFVLSDPNQGLYLPKLCWHEMNYSLNAVQLVLCSTNYDERDYIRSKDNFESLVKQHQNIKS